MSDLVGDPEDRFSRVVAQIEMIVICFECLIIYDLQGIGSKLMTKMGYEPGKGLGKDGVGRVEPVPIQLLPQGQLLQLSSCPQDTSFHN